MQSLGAAPERLSRREVLRGLALTAGSPRALSDGLPRLEMRSTERQLPVERSRFAFALSRGAGRPVEGAEPRVWLARDQTSTALGPFQTSWMRLDAYERTRDRSPRGDRANFIHLEVYPQRDANRPAPLYQAWGLRSVPWTVVISPDGHISARGEGPVAAPEITAAVRTVL